MQIVKTHTKQRDHMAKLFLVIDLVRKNQQLLLLLLLKYYSFTYLALCQADKHVNQNMSHPSTQHLEVRNRGLKELGARII